MSAADSNDSSSASTPQSALSKSKIRPSRNSLGPVRNYIRTSDSLSLWNFSSSPGWTSEESQVLRLAIMKHGLGNWAVLLGKSIIPGKTRGQLTLQTQRLCGQQSLGEFMGLHLDVQKVWERNQKLDNVKRKSGMIINEGNNPTKESRLQKIEYNRKIFELSRQEIDAVVVPRLREKYPQLQDRFMASAADIEKIKKQTELEALHARLRILNQQLGLPVDDRDSMTSEKMEKIATNLSSSDQPSTLATSPGSTAVGPSSDDKSLDPKLSP